MTKILIIQTAFIGDVILSTALIEKVTKVFPNSKIDFLLRKGNENILDNNPHLNNILIWNKNNKKYKELFKTLKKIRKRKYDYVFNLQRFFSSGFITVFSKAKRKYGFKKNPLSIFFTKSYEHIIDPFIEIHEVTRNATLLSEFTTPKICLPKLYPSENDFEKTKIYKTKKYICIAPASIWFTKQFPIKKWIEFINKIEQDINVYLLGSKSDTVFCNQIILRTEKNNVINLSGRLSILESAALIKDAAMNYVNDSAPLHIASAMNANTSAIFCSTVPGFGFGPLADNSNIIEVKEKLKCRPCGIHGKKECPEKHFKCAMDIDVDKMVDVLGN